MTPLEVARILAHVADRARRISAAVPARRSMACSVLCCAISGCGAPKETPNTTSRPSHHTAHGFKNPYIEDPQKNFFSYLAMKYGGDTEWADHAARAGEVPVQPLDLDLVNTKSDGVRISWLGHSTLLIQDGVVNILTDPIFADRASPLPFAGPRRYIPHIVDYTQLPSIDYVVISHNHYDHLDRSAVEQLGNQPIYLVPLGLKRWLVSERVSPARVVELDWWQPATFPDVSFLATPSQHWSARGLHDRRKTLWASWLVRLGDTKLWFAGDTGYNDVQFAEIGRESGGVDIALIPIGGYAPRFFMGPYHVDPEGAIKIHRDVRATTSIGIHWGAFPLTAEGPIDPVDELARQKQAYNLPDDAFVTLVVGETRMFSR